MDILSGPVGSSVQASDFWTLWAGYGRGSILVGHDRSLSCGQREVSIDVSRASPGTAIAPRLDQAHQPFRIPAEHGMASVGTAGCKI